MTQPRFSTAFSRRRMLTLTAGAAAATAGGFSFGGPDAAAAPPTPELAKAFEQAATRYGVPRDLLVGLAQSQTWFSNHLGSGGQFHAFGVTGLSESGPSGGNLAEAAKLTKVDAEQLKGDDAANIAGAAALLAARADQAGLAASARDQIEAWHPVLADFSGFSSELASVQYADSVYDALAAGSGDSRVRLAQRSVEPDRHTTVTTSARGQKMALGPAELKSQAGWAPADPANFTGANRPNDVPINKIIIHTTEGSYSSAINWFQNPAAQASAHYVIRSSDGATTQCVSHMNIAWHAGNWDYNEVSIGIEHEAYVNQPEWYTDTMYKSSASLVAQLCKQYGIPVDRSHIIAHSEVPGATHTDPGSNWDWSKYMSYVQGAATLSTWSQTVDTNTAGRFSVSSNWRSATHQSSTNGAGYRLSDAEAASDPAWFKLDVPTRGSYKIDVWHPTDSGYSRSTPYLVATTAGTKVVPVDQSAGGGGWKNIGNFTLEAGDRNVVGVSRWAGGSGKVVADGVRITQV